MISILIPIYNYNVEDLILKLKEELKTVDFNFEIICCDDFSKKNFNLKLNKDFSVTFFKNEKNIGRTETRQKLANRAKYDWLLFLDSDVIPVNDDFIGAYNLIIQKFQFDVSFGGISYFDQKPKKDYMLRWRYGRKKEMIPINKRTKTPFTTITSANLLIKRNVFININKQLKGNYYGYDNIFSLKLKSKSKLIKHIDNPVFHLGLEDNNSYLSKKRQAAETIYMLYKNKQISSSTNGLLNAFEFLKKLRLQYIVASGFKVFKRSLEKKLTGSNPNIFLLDCYRLGYFCSLNL